MFYLRIAILSDVQIVGLKWQLSRNWENLSKNGEKNKMRLTETAEELLEELWIQTQENTKKDITLDELNGYKERSKLRKIRHIHEKQSRDSACDELREEGLIDTTGDRICLSDKGVLQAREIIRRHRLAERLLVDILATKMDMVEDFACSFEHAIYAGIAENVCTLLGHPTSCPHGRSIPPGRCCQSALETTSPLIASLSHLRPLQKGTIAYIRAFDDKRLKKIIATGTIPGSPIQLIQTYPSYVFQVGQTQFAIDKEMADEIYVRIENQ